MKVGILAGGLGSRLAEETVIKPKPMIEIGGRPILWHIMMHYSTYGHKEFVVALGYKGEYIKRYMADYCSLSSDLRISLKDGHIEPHHNGNGISDREDFIRKSRTLDDHCARIGRPCGLCLASSATACSRVRPVLLMMLSMLPVSRSVWSVIPGVSSKTGSPSSRYRSARCRIMP